jgi:hypothetical protein
MKLYTCICVRLGSLIFYCIVLGSEEQASGIL